VANALNIIVNQDLPEAREHISQINIMLSNVQESICENNKLEE
jgi:hypothetical protein